MEIRQLKYFLAIADSGSISKAAERLFVAQSALSQQIAQLEHQLNVTLLHRSSRGVSLTECGVAFYEQAHVILRQIEEARGIAKRKLSESPSGSVTLGIPQSASAALAIPLLLAARRSFPNITLQFSEDLTGNLVEQLRQGRINLAVLFDDGQLGEFATKAFVLERMHLISAVPPSSSKPISLSEACASPLVLPTIQHGVRRRIERAAKEQGISLTGLVAEIDSFNILKGAVLSGLGATILPMTNFSSELIEGRVSAQAIGEPGISRIITLCASRNVLLSRATVAVAGLVVRVARELCDSGKWQGAIPLPDDDSTWLCSARPVTVQ